MNHGKKEMMLDQMASCMDAENWFAPLAVAIEGLQEEEALKHICDGVNSIFEIINHLFFWNDRYLRLFKGLEVVGTVEDNDATFRQEDADWQTMVKKLENIMIEWQNAIIECSTEKLESLRVGTKDKWSKIIGNIIIHNAYHIGQIVQIRKIQGTWKPVNW